MLGGTQEAALGQVQRWLEEFEGALSRSDFSSARSLFHQDGFWRDILAFTWHIQTVSGAKDIVHALKTHAGRANGSHFELAVGRTAPRLVTRAGSDVIEAIFTFKTARGPANGVLRLIPGDPAALSQFGV